MDTFLLLARSLNGIDLSNNIDIVNIIDISNTENTENMNDLS